MEAFSRTFVKTKNSIKKFWIIDCIGLRLGRIASTVAMYLQGKHRPDYSPHVEGDNVILINIDKIEITGNKARDKIYYSHSGYVGGLKERSYSHLLQKDPALPIRKAVERMLKKNKLRKELLRNFYTYVGPEHPHGGQKPEKITLSEAPSFWYSDLSGLQKSIEKSQCKKNISCKKSDHNNSEDMKCEIECNEKVGCKKNEKSENKKEEK